MDEINDIHVPLGYLEEEVSGINSHHLAFLLSLWKVENIPSRSLHKTMV